MQKAPHNCGVAEEPLSSRGSPLKRSASSQPRFNLDLENDSSADEDEEILLKKKLNVNGTFQSRKQQKRLENKRKVRELTIVSNNESAKGKNAAGLMHATAAKKQAETCLVQTKL